MEQVPNPARSAVPVESRGYLIDNSILQKLARSDRVRRRFLEITNSSPIFTCPPQVLEYCWSARDPGEYAELRADMELYTPAVLTPSQSAILDVQQALWNAGLMPSARDADVTMAAFALVNELTILTADRDFGHIEQALGDGRLKQEYVAE